MKLKTPDGFILDGEFKKVENSNKGIIFLHGMTVDRDEGIFVRSASKLNQLGFSTLRFDFRSHGKSSGNSINDFTISGELIDVQTVVEFMLKQRISLLGIAGASFGGGIASLYVGSNGNIIKALFLANPVLDYKEGFLNAKTDWILKYFSNFKSKLNKFGFVEAASNRYKIGKILFDQMKSYKPYNALNNYKGLVMIVHGDKDNIIPFDNIFNHFQELNNSKKQFKAIKGSAHGFAEEPYESEVVDLIINFFESNL